MTDINIAAGETTVEETPFDVDFAAFLGHNFADAGEADDDGNDTGTNTETAGAGEATVAGGNGSDTIVAGAGNDTLMSPNAADSGQQVSDDIDPALLAEMAGLAGPQGADTQAAPERQAGDETTTASSGEDFMPFTPTFDLPPAIVQGLFEAEDTETRQKSLVGVLSAFGNTITNVVMKEADRRVDAAITRYVAQQEERNVGRAITQHFYGKFPELDVYKPAVVKAFQVLAGKNQGGEYSEAIADQVAKLAKASLKQAGVKFEEKTVPAKTPVVKATVKKAPGSGFDAGGARPGGSLGEPTDDGPAALVDQMRDFGF